MRQLVCTANFKPSSFLVKVLINIQVLPIYIYIILGFWIIRFYIVYGSVILGYLVIAFAYALLLSK